MPTDLNEILREFASEHKFKGKGPLCVALVVTEHARKRGVPLDSETLVTQGGGQVLGLGKAAVQAVLKRHGIERVLAQEGGRTSRGSLKNMRDYVALLNELHENGLADIDAIEKYWIDGVRAFFAAKPFTIKLDASRGLSDVVRNILKQAVKRQEDAPGMNYAGAMLQHLVGAKLSHELGIDRIEHNSYSTADAPSNRPGDFTVGDVVIHVTMAAGEAVIERCHDNLDSGYRPILITTREGIAVAEGLARNKELAHRIDIFDIEQFVALNLYEWGKFATEHRRAMVVILAKRYNEIIDSVETDPSLKIKVKS